MALGKGQSSFATLGLYFGPPSSDRDGSAVVRLDIKSDRNTSPVEIRPPLSEMLRPVNLSNAKYLELDAKLTGMYQRMSNKFMVNPSRRSDLPQQILRHANVVS